MRLFGLIATSRSARPHRTLAAIVALTLVASFVSPVFATDTGFAHDFGPGKYTADLVAGAKMVDVGDVEIFNDQQKLYINVLADGWTVAEVKIYVGQDPVPVNSKGLPVMSYFPYGQDTGLTSEYRLALDVNQDLGVKWGKPHAATWYQNGSWTSSAPSK